MAQRVGTLRRATRESPYRRMLVLLAHAPADVRQRVLSSPLRRYTTNTVVDPGRCGWAWP